MEILAALAGIAVLLWYFVARPRKAAMAYQIHRDHLDAARQLLERYDHDPARRDRVPWELGEAMSRTLSNLRYHVDETRQVELGHEKTLRELIEDLAFAQAIDLDQIQGSQRQAFRARALDGLVEDMARALEQGRDTELGAARLREALSWTWEAGGNKPKRLAEARSLARRLKRAAGSDVDETDDDAPPAERGRKASRPAKTACDVCGELARDVTPIGDKRVCGECVSAGRGPMACDSCGILTDDRRVLGPARLCPKCFNRQRGVRS